MRKELRRACAGLHREALPLSPTDKRCFMALAGLLAAVTVVYEATDGTAIRASERVEKPLAELTWEAPVNQPRLLEAITVQLERNPYRADVPLDRELQAVLREACGEHGVPVHLALGLIEVESGFQPEADNGLCYGLMQLNKRYYPDDLSPRRTSGPGWPTWGSCWTDTRTRRPP